MRTVRVSDHGTRKVFHRLAKDIYRNDKNWICPLSAEIEKIFDPKYNKSFLAGDAVRWILINKTGQPIGRIAAFYNRKEAEKWAQVSGGIGFFECINSQKAANLLFNQAKLWLASNKIEAMDGPVNFGENMFNWGLLVEGFRQQGYGMQYHPSYYRILFENYGFKTFYKQFSYHLDLKKPFPEVFWKVANRVIQKPDIECKHFNFKQRDKFIHDLIEIYNETWFTFREESSPIIFEEIVNLLDDAKEFLVEEFIWFVYKNGEPVCFMVMFPDLNQLLRHINGELNLYTKLKLLFYSGRKEISRARAFAMGIKPKYQRLGFESAIFWNLKQVFERLDHFHEIELSWSGDFNPKIISLYKAAGAVHSKTHHTYRYLFDREKPFERYQQNSETIVPRRAREKLANQIRSK